MGLRVYRVDCVSMVKRMLDFLRVKNNGGPYRISYWKYIHGSSYTSDSHRYMGRV